MNVLRKKARIPPMKNVDRVLVAFTSFSRVLPKTNKNNMLPTR